MPVSSWHVSIQQHDQASKVLPLFQSTVLPLCLLNWLLTQKYVQTHKQGEIKREKKKRKTFPSCFAEYVESCLKVEVSKYVQGRKTLLWSTLHFYFLSFFHSNIQTVKNVLYINFCLHLPLLSIKSQKSIHDLWPPSHTHLSYLYWNVYHVWC